MKTFVASIAIALATVATAQLDNIPSCALNCFVTPLTNDGCSSLTDFACHCKKFDSLISSVTPCVQGACSASDQEATIQAVEQTCDDAGVSVSVSEPASTGASSAAASSTGGSSEPASSAATTTVVTSVASTAVVTSSVASSNGTATVTTGSPSTTAASSAAGASGSSSAFTGAAAQATQAVGVLGAAALALFAL